MVGEADAGAFVESSAYVEAPVRSGRVAVVAAPWAGEDPEDPKHHWRSEATLGAKASLMRTRFAAMAGQAGIVWRSDPEPRCGHVGAEARWLGGVSLGREHRAFLNAEIAARAAEGGCASTRVDVTAGYRRSERWLGMAQVFTESRRGDDTALLAQVTVVRFQSHGGRGLQVGIRARLDGEEREPALVIGLWGGGATWSRSSDRR